MNDYDRDHVEEILFDSKRYDWFTCRLMRLICHADRENRAKLAISFPEEVKVICEYLGHQVPVTALIQLQDKQSV